MPNSPRAGRVLLGLACWGLLIAPSPAIRAEEPAATDRPTFDRLVAGLGPGVRYGIDAFQVSQDGTESRSFRRQSDAVLPTASAIKTAIMIEMFAKFRGRLDEPAPGLDAILKDDHPAVAHFDPDGRDEIRAGLSGASVRRIGRVMLGSEGATNRVYNAASNVAIALLGGPDETTRLIHTRDPAFAPIQVRRYMLTDRKVRGDNESSAEGLAAVLRRLASREIPGLDPATVEACRMAVEVADDPIRGRRRFKDGALDSPPITRASTGWYEGGDGPAIVYVVMLAQDDPGDVPPAEAAARLQAAAERIAEAAVDALRRPAAFPGEAAP